MLSKAAKRDAEQMGRDGLTPHDAYRAAESRFGTGRRPANADKRRAFVDAYRAAFDAAGWRWQIHNWNAVGNAAGRVVRA